MWVVVGGGGGIRANTVTSRSSARAGAATTMSIFFSYTNTANTRIREYQSLILRDLFKLG